MHDYRERIKREYANFFSATVELTGIAAKLLPIQPENSLQRTIRYLTASITNSNVALALLCMNGHGADAVKIARGMFESQITLKYLILNPSASLDFLEFELLLDTSGCSSNKSHHPELYRAFPESKKSEVERAFARVSRFTGLWCI